MNHTRLRVLDISGNTMLSPGQIGYITGKNRMLRELGLNGINLGDLGVLMLFDNEVMRPYALTRLDLKNTGLSQINMLEQFATLQSLDLSDPQRVVTLATDDATESAQISRQVVGKAIVVVDQQYHAV